MTDNNKEKFYQELGFSISEFRNATGMSQQVLAEKVGLSRTSIVNIEKGRQHPPLHILWIISDNLGVSLSQIIPDFEYERSEINSSLKNLIRKKKRRDDLNDESYQKISSFIKKSFG